jgi:hypothetical protein
MTIRYKCEECGAALNINDELAGTEGSCPRCHVEFVVPSADADAAKPAKAEKPRSSGSLSTEDEIGDFLSSDEIPIPSGQTSLAESDDSDAGASRNPFDEHAIDDEPPRHRQAAVADEDGDGDDDDELERRSKKKSKSKDDGKAAKRDTANAASIAKSLMGKGGPVVEEEPDPSPKKKRKQFGEGSDRPEGEITSAREMVTYFAKMGWPGALGFVAVIVLCVWVYDRMQKKLVPPAPLANVSGTVTIDGKPVAQSTIVQFLPMEAAKNPKLGSSTGFTGENGKYTLHYTNEFAGAVIGKHYVLITPSDPNQGIPARYATTFGNLQADVTKDNKPIDFALQSDPPPEK